MILVDSSVWIDYFNGAATLQTDKLDRLLGREPLVIGDLILAEVLQGFNDNRDDDRDSMHRERLQSAAQRSRLRTVCPRSRPACRRLMFSVARPRRPIRHHMNRLRGFRRLRFSRGFDRQELLAGGIRGILCESAIDANA